MKKAENRNRKTDALEKETGRHKNSAVGKKKGQKTQNINRAYTYIYSYLLLL